jgi:hypothetical protein
MVVFLFVVSGRRPFLNDSSFKCPGGISGIVAAAQVIAAVALIGP